MSATQTYSYWPARSISYDRRVRNRWWRNELRICRRYGLNLMLPKGGRFQPDDWQDQAIAQKIRNSGGSIIVLGWQPRKIGKGNERPKAKR